MSLPLLLRYHHFATQVVDAHGRVRRVARSWARPARLVAPRSGRGRVVESERHAPRSATTMLPHPSTSEMTDVRLISLARAPSCEEPSAS
jgi:hypothetical protein